MASFPRNSNNSGLPLHHSKDHSKNHSKVSGIIIKREPNNSGSLISKSWNGFGHLDRPFNKAQDYFGQSRLTRSNNHRPGKKKSQMEKISGIYNIDYKPYDAVSNCKSAGVIPYAIVNGQLLFLFQKTIHPLRKKDSGWNDFGGKKISSEETTAEVAAREFSEETSCLFYLACQNNEESRRFYQLLKNNNGTEYNDETITILKKIIPVSQQFYTDKITKYVIPLYISSKETYISYFVKVNYIPESDLPVAEDMHIPYETRYLRECKWFSYDELMKLDEKDFHKRLQITRILQRIKSYHQKELF